MNAWALRTLWVLAATTGTLWGTGRGWAQAPTSTTPAWQPYRESGEVLPTPGSSDLSKAIEDPSLTPAQFAQPQEMTVVDPSMPCPPGMEAFAACPQPMFAAPPYGVSPYATPMYVDASGGAPPNSPQYWQWRLLPENVIWQSYWAGMHEPRISGVAFHNAPNNTNYLDVTLGGRASLLRYGTDGSGRPEGAELQIEGAAFPRLNLDANWDVEAVDFRFGVPLIYGREKWQTKFSYYHLSSHMGDEYAIREHALADRINFSRDVLVLGFSYFPLPAWRWYTEAGWAFHYDESEPWEFQFGVDVAQPGPTGPIGAPFFAVNGHIREELDYGGNVVAQIGWFWRGNGTNVLRTGFHYFNGKSNQFEFFRNFEEQLGVGLWYEF
jgi:hypothetical protein